MTKRSRKIVVMGFRGVGKSTITTRFCDGTFTPQYTPTIESTQSRSLDRAGVEYEVTILDTAGQDEFSVFQRRYGVGVDGYMFVYCADNAASLAVVRSVNDRVLDATGVETIPRVLVGNKADTWTGKAPPPVRAEAVALAAAWGCVHVDASAKDNVGIDEAFAALLDQIDPVVATAQPPSTCVIQ
eukprot:CAMPEP_0170754944 /NCGR_PEP_ID=MMETSP0437-20130122/13263_1 /TAXON_ID=0 /ORGANISM="Sexangularia sp." /LENGTH=184 /DNA_ID=CAMNT_0011094097 /DNA_START=148 /DNA_END=702 /DNA_ORIENTATION=-